MILSVWVRRFEGFDRPKPLLERRVDIASQGMPRHAASWLGIVARQYAALLLDYNNSLNAASTDKPTASKRRSSPCSPINDKPTGNSPG